jgi:hypothetical protein
MMRDQENLPGTDFTSTRIAAGIYLGRLLSPEDVATATHDRQGGEYVALRRWTLCGDVSPGIFDYLRARALLPPADENVTWFEAAGGERYAVFVHEAACIQHRFLVPLYEERTLDFLAQAERSGFGYSLSGDGAEAIVWRSALGARHLESLRHRWAPIRSATEEAAFSSFAPLVAALRSPKMVPSLRPGGEVSRVSVTAVPPLELCRRLGVAKGGLN